MQTEILIIGAGVAGLFTALKLAPRPVTIITARALGRGGSSIWAQGGIAAAVGSDDTPALHLADTIAAGDGLVDHEAAKILTEEGPARIEDLLRLGVPFDQNSDGSLKVGREAAHSRDRIVHAGGDQAGAAIMAALVEAAQKAEHITILERIVVEDLLTAEGIVGGVLALNVTKGERLNIYAAHTILATGGLGGLYAVTTNPIRAQGHGLAFAARAGAIIRDPEFVQFHPTAIDIGADPAPLATEALRGDGAILINNTGQRFMVDQHPDAELAPRDVVARAVEAERSAGRRPCLDARHAIGAAFPQRFPAVYAACRQGGFDPCTDPFPIAPAAHYHMGGILTDLDGRASLEGLWAVGEVSSTGVHGANRLASNSLLEAVVFGHRTAEQLREIEIHAPIAARAPEDRLALPPKPPPDAAITLLRNAMSSNGALLRSAEGLSALNQTIEQLQAHKDMTSGLKSALTVAALITAAALPRQESRGGHYRTDYPTPHAASVHSLVQWQEGQPAVTTAPVNIERSTG